jgi:hypothetical protein
MLLFFLSALDGRVGLAEEIWAILMISAGLIIAIATMLRNRDIAYGLVIVWAYAGILLKTYFIRRIRWRVSCSYYHNCSLYFCVTPCRSIHPDVRKEKDGHLKTLFMR